MEQENITQQTDGKSFAELLEENLDVKDDTENSKIVSGTVVRIDKDVVFIDLGFKSEGIVPLDEFKDKDGEADVEIGKEVEILLEMSKSGIPKVSKKKADFAKEKEHIDNCYKNGEKIEGTILNRVKGGFLCDIGKNSEFKAFLPGSQVNIHSNSNNEELIGQSIEAKIIQYDNKGIVISRRRLQEEERDIKRKETLSNIEEGNVVSGEVVNIIDKGVFVEFGGVTGFIPVSELSWGRINKPADVAKVNDKLDVKVINIQNGGKRVTLSLKQTQADPWSSVSDKYKAGSKVSGKVVSTKDFGVFVQLEPGVEGLVHVSELTWTKSFSHPKEIIDIDSPVEVIVLEVKPDERRLSLSLRQIEPSPWEIFKNNNPKDSVIKGAIKNINEHGIFVEVADGLVGLVRPENISWSGRVKPTEVYEPSEIEKEIEVAVLNVDTKNRRIALGIKQLSDDPWELMRNKYKPGESTIKGKVKEVTPNALIVELENEIEGFFKTSDLNLEANQEPKQIYKIGDEVEGLVTGFNKSRKQVNLSIKRLEQKLERDRVSNFVSSQGDTSAKLGDLFGEEFKNLDNN